jgi:hypothetical protein
MAAGSHGMPEWLHTRLHTYGTKNCSGCASSSYVKRSSVNSLMPSPVQRSPLSTGERDLFAVYTLHVHPQKSIKFPSNHPFSQHVVRSPTRCGKRTAPRTRIAGDHSQHLVYGPLALGAALVHAAVEVVQHRLRASPAPEASANSQLSAALGSGLPEQKAARKCSCCPGEGRNSPPCPV